MPRWTKADLDRLNAKREGRDVPDTPDFLDLAPNQIWLPGHTPSLKNGKRCFGRGRAVHAPAVGEYATGLLPHLIALKPKWDSITQGLDRYFLMYQFVRNYCWTHTRKKGANAGKTYTVRKKQVFDFTGCHDMINDCLSAQIYQFNKERKHWKYTKLVGKDNIDPDQVQWIPDDNYQLLATYPHSKVIWNCDHPGAILTVIKASDVEAFERLIIQL